MKVFNIFTGREVSNLGSNLKSKSFFSNIAFIDCKINSKIEGLALLVSKDLGYSLLNFDDIRDGIRQGHNLALLGKSVIYIKDVFELRNFEMNFLNEMLLNPNSGSHHPFFIVGSSSSINEIMNEQFGSILKENTLLCADESPYLILQTFKILFLKPEAA